MLELLAAAKAYLLAFTLSGKSFNPWAAAVLKFLEWNVPSANLLQAVSSLAQAGIILVTLIAISGFFFSSMQVAFAASVPLLCTIIAETPVFANVSALRRALNFFRNMGFISFLLFNKFSISFN